MFPGPSASTFPARSAAAFPASRAVLFLRRCAPPFPGSSAPTGLVSSADRFLSRSALNQLTSAPSNADVVPSDVSEVKGISFNNLQFLYFAQSASKLLRTS